VEAAAFIGIVIKYAAIEQGRISLSCLCGGTLVVSWLCGADHAILAYPLLVMQRG
jgi:hypothetical protein